MTDKDLMMWFNVIGFALQAIVAAAWFGLGYMVGR